MKNIFVFLLLVFTFSLFTLHPSLAQEQGQANLDKLLFEYKSQKLKDTALVNLLNDIAFEYYQIDPAKGIQFATGGLQLSEKIDSKTHQAIILNTLAVNYWAQSNYSEALRYFSRALKINEELKDKKGISRNMGNIGMVYYNLSDYPKALEYYFKAVKISEELGNKESMANKYSNIGLVYDKQKNYYKALEYYNRSLDINTIINNRNGIAINLGNIGNTYTQLKNYKKAIEYHTRALEMDEVLGNKRGTASDLGNLGEAYTYIGDLDQGIIYQMKALEIRKEINNKRGIMFSYGGLSNIYLLKAKRIDDDNNKPGSKENYLKLCLDYGNKAVAIAKNIDALEEKGDWYQVMSQAHKEMNNWKVAYMYTDSFNTVQDSVFNQQNRVKMTNIQNRREMDLKETELELFRTKDERRRIAIFAISGGLLLMMIIAFLIYRNLQHKAKISKLLESNYQTNVTEKDGMQIAQNMVQKEVKKASKYVTSLLPARLTHGTFQTDYLYIPSKQLGGDCFGYHWIDDKHFAIYILDVCGQGISSALHSVSVLNILRSSQRLNANPRHPEKVLGALNDAFKMEDHGNLFFSIWYGVIEIQEPEPDPLIIGSPIFNLSYTCAGHPSPLLFAPSGEIKELGPPSLSVGCMPDTNYLRHQTHIQPGSKLLLYSDGTYEVNKEDGSIMNIGEFKQLAINSYQSNELSVHHLNKLMSQHNTLDTYEDDFSLLIVET